MPEPTTDTIPGLLLRNLSREIVMGVEDALVVGARRAYAAAHGMDDGHLPHVVGQLRHFHMNESFQRALAVSGASPTPILGNGVVMGRAGIFTLARFNTSNRTWINGRRSHTRRLISMKNMAIEPLAQPDLFADYSPASDAVAFFVSGFSGSLHLQPESPLSIHIAVPDRNMRRWLFAEPVDAFLKRYDQEPAAQVDLAIPKLKRNINRQSKDGTSP